MIYLGGSEGAAVWHVATKSLTDQMATAFCRCGFQGSEASRADGAVYGV